MASQENEAYRRGLNVRDAIVFLLDWRLPMLKKDPAIDIAEDICATPGTSSILSITLRCVADIMKSKIIGRSADAVSLVAFGARGKTPRQGWPGVRVIRPLRQCDAAGVKQLQRIAQRLEAGESDALLDMDSDQVAGTPVGDDDPHFCFGPDQAVEFDKALWAARHQLTALSASKNSVVHRKRVFVFTNDDDPSRGSDVVKTLSIRHAKDLADLGATLDVSILTSPNMLAATMSMQTEDVAETSTFFNDLVYTDEDATQDNIGSVTIATVYSFEELRTRVRRKEMTKRALRKTVLVLANEYKIGVTLYALVRKAVRPTKVQLVASTNKPAYKITTNTCESVGEILKQKDIRQMYQPDYLKNSTYRTPGTSKPTPSTDGNESSEEAGKPVYGFTKAETVKAKALGQVGLYMYGFRKKETLPKEYTLGPATFVYPDESNFVGSTKSFVCLWKCMILRGVIGIVSVRLSETSTTGMRFAALVPQEEVFTENGSQLKPGGFQLHYLPYKDDVYSAWRKEMEVPSQEEDGDENNDEPQVKQEDMISGELSDEPVSVSTARKMVQKLTVRKYSPEMFLNPDLQRFYAGLEHAAGVETSFNPQDDLLNPNVEQMKKRAEAFATEVKRLEVGVDFDGDEEAERFGTKTKKRAAERSDAALRKEQKAEADKQYAIENCDMAMYLCRYQEGTLNKLLKPELQLYCRAHGLRDKGTKKTLVIAVEDHIAASVKAKEGTS